MHYKQQNKIYSGLIQILNAKAKDRDYKVETEFNEKEMTFTIRNINPDGNVIYQQEFGYKKPQEKDALIARAYQQYFRDMFEYGLIMNNESFLTANR